MPFRRKILYYGLLLLLTLLALEGMARIAYYAAYGQGYGGGRLAAPENSPAPDLPAVNLDEGPISHPFYGFSHNPAYGELNAMPPRQRRADTVVIGLLGGSVAEEVEPFFQAALSRWFAANNLPRQPVVLRLAAGAAKQPQQTIIIANTLLLGGEFDLIVNLDGFNEMVFSAGRNFAEGVFPFYPSLWNYREAATGAEALLAGRIRVLRREQARLTAAGKNFPLRWSALFGLAQRWRQERTAAAIIQRNHELAAIAADFNLEKQGPRSWLQGEGELRAESARLWYRGSVALAQLAELAGAEYYHFLQPNQYVPEAKPLSPEELASYYDPALRWLPLVKPGYPLLQELCRDLQSQGVPCFDLTGIFADRPETLYKDTCCHLNNRGNELLAAAMVQRLEPALRRLGRENPAAAATALAAARLPAEFGSAGAPGFRVSLQDNGKQLRYVREGCAPDDAGPLFFLHLIPRNWADLPQRREQGFADFTFHFSNEGGRWRRGQCSVQFPLPDYPIAALRTGQQTPLRGELWSAELIVPVAADQLRADYAALSAADPVVQDYFALYARDNVLIYLRETCAAADTEAPFFLHIIPENPADLPADRRPAGFAHAGFDFARQGGHFDGKCLASVALPEYPIKAMRTGQHIPGQGDLWAAEIIVPAALDQLRADYAARAAAEPVARDYFDLYDWDNRLLYRRETCAAADTAAPFFLHIIPENPAALPAERRDAGFAHAGFVFARQGGHFDGKCLASVALPEYPIAALRTGQYVPGQGELWSVELMAAP